MNRVLFKVDDFCFDGWETGKPAVENWNKFLEIISTPPLQSIKISLGIVGRTLDTIPQDVIDRIKFGLGWKIELFNHSYEHSDTPATAADAWKNQDKINEVFGVVPTVYGAPRNDVSSLDGLTMLFFKRDIPISAYRELENVTDSSFVQWDNFVDKYYKKHEDIKVYQLHPTTWSESDRMVFKQILDVMIKDGKKWIFASEYNSNESYTLL